MFGHDRTPLCHNKPDSPLWRSQKVIVCPKLATDLTQVAGGTAGYPNPLNKFASGANRDMAEHQQEAFREPADPRVNPPDSATNRLAGPVPIFALLFIVLAVAAIVAFVMVSGATR